MASTTPVPSRKTLAIDIAQQSAGRLITGLTQQKKQVVADTIARGFENDWPDSKIVAELKRTAGLSPRQAIALRNYQNGLRAKNVPPGKINQLADAYSKRLLNDRAQMIAANEVNNVDRQVDRAHFQQLQQNGDLPSRAVRVTRNSADSVPCPICKKENGKRRSLSHVDGGPPFHPNCRCYEQVMLDGDPVDISAITQNLGG